MKTLLIPAAALMLALTGCAAKDDAAPQTTASTETPAAAAAAPAQPAASIDGKKEVAYRCGAKNNDPLRVMYGFQGDNVVAAQVMYKEQASPILYRDASQQDSNVFTAPQSGITWIADSATAATVDKVNGNMLTQAGTETVNGKQMEVSQIVTKYCKLDKKETVKLNQPAKK